MFSLMRELFEEVFAGQAVDPADAARRAMRPRLRRRFYREVAIETYEGGCRLLLDGRPLRTPARRALAAPGQTVASALAEEWEAQREVIDPARMPLTRLANSIIDGVAGAPTAVTGDVEKYLASDLVCYRADRPDGLVRRQATAWDPIVAWARETLGARFVLAASMTFIRQPDTALAAASAAIPRHPWPLGAVHSVTTLTGSALLALALAHGQLSLENAWAAAHVDEDWNMEQWGHDELALERRSFRFAEMRAAVLVLDAARAEPLTFA